MWSDLSFSATSWDGRSFGVSWGLTWEANQELLVVVGPGGPDSASHGRGRSGYTEQEESEHLAQQAEHGRRMYAPPTVSSPFASPRGTPPPAKVAPEAIQAPVPFSSDIAEVSSSLAATAIAVASLSAEIELKQRDEEEALLLMLLS